jgi:hypothetical protein
MAGLMGWMIVYAVVLGLLLAWLEVQIEGKHGWAENLPCWQKENGWLVEKIWGGRPLTSYHIALILFLFAMLHSFFFAIPWNLQSELFILGLQLELLLFDDFFWFAINPHFGLKKFKKGEIWWHKHWIGPVPDLYIYLIPVCAIFLYFGYAGIS